MNSLLTAQLGMTKQRHSLEVTMQFKYDGLRNYCLSTTFKACFPE
jgi:hypothetical protein